MEFNDDFDHPEAKTVTDLGAVLDYAYEYS